MDLSSSPSQHQVLAIMAAEIQAAERMHTEFRRAIVPKEIRSLVAFDHKAFDRGDWFERSAWRECEAWWMIVAEKKVGCCAFQAHTDFQEDIRDDFVNPHREGSLYVATTGVLPSFQGLGFGRLMKSWQVSYARRNRFTRIVTNTRLGNKRMIELNKKFEFKVSRTTDGYYEDPKEATVVMELLLRAL
jgi:ribosomal protein S18 acetylase RimI-like enzyme